MGHECRVACKKDSATKKNERYSEVRGIILVYISLTYIGQNGESNSEFLHLHIKQPHIYGTFAFTAGIGARYFGAVTGTCSRLINIHLYE